MIQHTQAHSTFRSPSASACSVLALVRASIDGKRIVVVCVHKHLFAVCDFGLKREKWVKLLVGEEKKKK